MDFTPSFTLSSFFSSIFQNCFVKDVCVREFSKLLFPGWGKWALMINKAVTVEIGNTLLGAFSFLLSLLLEI